jgi:Uma2 family endonuclease
MKYHFLMSPEPVEKLGEAEYIAAERRASEKSEFLDGRVVAMAGGSPRHNLLCANATAALANALRGRGCVVLSSDQRIAVEETGLFAYPDVTVVCGGVQLHPRWDDTITNPTVLVEVLSPSTEGYDRGAKFAHYRRIPSLRAVLLVSPEQPFIERFERGEGDTWHLTTWTPAEERVPIPAIAVEIAIAAVYEGVDQLPPIAGRDASPGRLPGPRR